MSELLNKSYHCKACECTLKTYNNMRLHLLSEKHKNNVVKYFPETLLYKKINGEIEFYTGRLDLKKVGDYIIPIQKIKITKNKKNSKNSKNNENIIPILNKENYKYEYYHLDLTEMCKLIDDFTKYIKYYNIDPDQLFNYEYFINNKDNEEDIIDIYIEVKDLVFDDEFQSLIK